MGYNPRADWHHATSPLPQVTLRLDQFKEAQEQARTLMIKAQQSWVKHKDMPKYKEGDLVWLEGRNLHLSQPTPKLVPRRHGPFKIIQVMSPVNYRLELPTQWSIHPVFHINLLTPYCETITHGPNYQRLPPNLVDNEEEYRVEKILDSRLFGWCKRLQYLVKWAGYPDSDNMWVDKDDVFAEDKVWEFKLSNPAARMHIRYIGDDGMPQFPLPLHTSSLIHCLCPTMALTPPMNPVPLRLTICDHDHQGPPTLLKSPQLSLECQSALLPSQQPNLTNPRVSLLFQSPTPNSLGMQTALLWRRKQLCTERIRLAHCNKECVEQGMIPISQTTSRILNCALKDVDQWSTATDTTPPHLCRYLHHDHPYLTPLQPHHSEAWPHFSSIVKTPQRWHVNSSRHSTETTKMPLKYRQPIPREKSLPKGWVYNEGDVAVKTEDLTNPSLYELTCPRLMRAQRQLEEHRHRPRRAMSTTEELTTSHSLSPTTTGDPHQPASSKST